MSIPSGIKPEVAGVRAQGVDIDLLFHDGQCFVRVRGLATPAPAWGNTSQDILIAVPMAYETAGLDAFYLRQPHTFNGGSHPRVNGPTLTIDGITWRLVSWHYPDDKRWIVGQDSLGNHIEHCRGFFLNRKAVNAY